MTVMVFRELASKQHLRTVTYMTSQGNQQLEERWEAACRRMVARLGSQVSKSTPPPEDAWERWCREQERRGDTPVHVYFPSNDSSLIMRCGGGFSQETPEQWMWREASNRMKRAIELWKKHADDIADDWARWCGNREMNQSGGRLKDW